ncbi:MAG TPA: protein phosphatase 2C domain-containing protein [Thermodesulfobacteriota bacterium]|nr:protein phosphatase 2C domain-containing protein [Thermodesulfobacteriota bacterium]
MEIAGETHQGLKRANNQDRFLVREFGPEALLMAVADGMGGEAAGDQAAQIAIDSLTNFQSEAADPLLHLQGLFKQASENIEVQVRRNFHLSGMGTTLTAVFLLRGRAYWTHVGDSRLYLFRAGKLSRVTWDHTLPDTLLRKGNITSEEARNHPAQNLLLQCIGCGRFKASTGVLELEKEDILLVSSDGLHHEVPEEEIAGLLTGLEELSGTLKSLVQAALNAGGRDNITIVAVRV